MRGLGIEYTDIVLLGWWNLPPPDPILDAAAKMVRRGVARHVMVSCHHRPSFPLMARDPRISLLMVRYNAAHPGAERDVFPFLPEQRPGMIAHTSTSWGQRMDSKLAPAGERVPTATDCYRFVLTNPFIDACYSGAKNGRELDDALRALDLGRMDEDEIPWIPQVGASVWERSARRRAASNLIELGMNFISDFGFRSSAEAARHMQHG